MSEGPFRPRGRAPQPPPAQDDPPPAPGPPAPPPGRSSQATWILGVVIVLALAYITANTIATDQPGSRGVQPGSRLPPFAAPLASGPLQGDANVLVKAADGVPRACAVRGPGVFNSCQAAGRGPLVLGFLATRSRRCIEAAGVLDRLQRRFPDVQFAVVAIRGDRDDVRRLVREERWTLPVAHDRDGAVSNAYAIAVCPTVTFARRGGVVTHTTLGEAGEAEIVHRIEELR